MLAYATFADFQRMKDAKLAFSAPGERLVRDYLQRATQYIDATTRRRFFPFRETRIFGVPTRYADLRNRGLIYDDLPLDADLLEAFDVRTATGAIITETTLTAPLSRYATTATVATTAGMSANDVLLIDAESVRVVRVASGTSIQIERGVHQSRAQAHNSAASVGLQGFIELEQARDFFLLDFNRYPKYALRLTYPNSWAGPYAGGRWLWREPQIYVTGFFGYNERYDGGAWADTRNAVGLGGLTDSATSIPLADVDDPDTFGNAPSFEEGMLLRIDDELMWVLTVDDNGETVGVQRGVHGTVAVAHDAGAPVLRWSVHEEIREACLVIAKTWRDADNSVGGRQGVSEVSTGVQIAMPADITAILRRYVRAAIL